MTTGTTGSSKGMLWTGRVLSALIFLLMAFSAAMKFAKPASVVQGFAHDGIPEGQIVPLGIVELACAIIYVIPRLSILGAILLTGYLGGATETMLRVGDPYPMPVVVGVLAWGGLFLRDARIRALIPICRSSG